jgi:cysteine sulfinate desulfinase/cysteine desulfurase-like protein
MDVNATELVNALRVALGRDEDQETVEYLVDNLAEAIATLMSVLDELLNATRDDERQLL